MTPRLKSASSTPKVGVMEGLLVQSRSNAFNCGRISIVRARENAKALFASSCPSAGTAKAN